MKSIKEKIDTYIKLVQIPTENVLERSVEIFEFLSNINTDDINSNMRTIAELFCATLSQLKIVDLQKTHIENSIIKAYGNIKNMDDIEETTGDTYCSNMMVMMFLKKLNNMVDNEPDLDTISEPMQNQFEELSENLENIKIIFKVKSGNKEMFPIGRLLSSVISAERFRFNKLDIKTLNTLLLALEVFNTTEYQNEEVRLKKLIDDCDIKCLAYLEKDSVKRFDEQSWKMNFKKNGVLILADIMNKKILIRHEERGYFSKLPTCEIANIKDERNIDGKIIASYYEYEYTDREDFISLEKIVLSKNRAIQTELLKIIYNGKNYNCFFNDAFLICGNTIKLVNPCTSNDITIVRGSGDESTFNSSVGNVTNECMSNYWLELYIHCGLNCASIGLLCNLLTLEDVDVNLLIGNIDDNENYQSQIIRNWVFATVNSYSSLVSIQDKYFKHLSYVQSFTDMKNTTFSGLYLYPIKFEDLMVDDIFKEEYGDEYKIIPIFEKAKFLIDFHGKAEGLLIGDVTIASENIIYIDNEFSAEEQIYVVRVENDKWLVSKLVNNLGMVKSKINIENQKLLPLETMYLFADSHIGYVKSRMEKHEKGLLDQNNVRINFDSMVKFRLANNIISYKINTIRKRDIFLEILGRHDITTFENIVNVVDLNSEGTLYVPKERQESDSVLTSIINKYLRRDCLRNIDLYNTQIELKNSKYYLRGHEIKEIVILFDTLQKGGSTKRTLGFYFENFGKPTYQNHPNRTMEYYAENNKVSLESIMHTNKASLAVRILNGTKEGEDEIEKYFSKKGIDTFVKCEKYITSFIDEELISKCKELYNFCSMNEGQYPIIREFNQPKMNLFPKDMLDPDNVFSLFVIKKEHN